MIWPPQNTGIFELKMPCCTCVTDCRSKCGHGTLPPCDPPYPSYCNFTHTETISGHVFAFDITFTGVDNHDGTWTFTLTINSCTIDGVPVIGHTCWPPFGCSGTDYTCSGGFAIYDGGTFLQKDCLEVGGFCFFMDTGTGFQGFNVFCLFQSAGFAERQEIASVIVDGVMADGSVPYDTSPNCDSGFVSNSGPADGTYTFCYFQKKFTFTELTVGNEYCISIVWEYRTIGVGAWSDLTTTFVDFTATDTTEVTDWLDPYNLSGGGHIAGVLQGKEYRVKSVTITPGSCGGPPPPFGP